MFTTRPSILALAAAGLLALGGWVPAAHSQARPSTNFQSRPTLDALVAQWSEGVFRSPLLCEFEGELIRGVRRVLIRSHMLPGRAATTSLEFVDIRPGPATRCMDATGTPVPNLIGKLELQRPRHRHPETAKRDFKRALKQDKGFEYRVAGGTLEVQVVEVPAPEPQVLDFEAGTAPLSLVFPATDAALALSDFATTRKLVLTLKSSEGETFVLPLFDPSAPPK